MTVLKGNQPMSDLIVRSNSASPRGDKSQQIPAGVGIPQNGDQIEFKDILRILRRRRKLVFVTAGAVFALSLVNAVYQRNVNPIYAGSFTLLISDPLSVNPPPAFQREVVYSKAGTQQHSKRHPHIDRGVAQLPVSRACSETTQYLGRTLASRSDSSGRRQSQQGPRNSESHSHWAQT